MPESLTRSFVVESPEKMQAQQFPLPEIGPEEMLLRVEQVSICGSDPHHYRGERLNPTLPMILGHEVVGRIERVGTAVAEREGIAEGDRRVVEPYIPCRRCVYCLNSNYQLCENKRCYGVNLSSEPAPHLLGAYGEYLMVLEGSRTHLIDEAVPAEAASLTSVIGNGFRWIKVKGRVQWGETLVTIGAGAQALASVVVASEVGANPIIVIGLERDAHGFEVARELGATHTVAADTADPIAAVREITGGEMADVVVEASGAAPSLGLATDLLRPLGRCVVAGFLGGREVSVYTEKIARKELTLLGGLGQAWSMEDAARMINARSKPIEKMITHVFPMDEAPDAMRFFIDRPTDCIRCSLKP